MKYNDLLWSQKMIRNIIIAGNGKLSSSLMKNLPEYISNSKVDHWSNNVNYPNDNKVIVHIGSGRQFDDILNFCKKTKTPLIQGSTDITGNFNNVDFTYIDAPNFNLLMLKFMHMIKQYGFHFQDNKISITESHQESKTSLPGTAYELAKSLGLDSEKIKSIRDSHVQEKQYGIPKEHLQLHAFHEINIGDESTSINIKTLVKGHESYAAGIAAIINVLDSLKNKYYHIMDLIEMNLI